MKYELVAFDLDGTLTPSKSPLQPDMSELLVKLLEKCKVAVISGASLKQFEKQFLGHLTASPSELSHLYILPTNGASLCQYKAGWLCEHSYDLSEEEKNKIYTAFKEVFAETHFEPPAKLYGEQIEDRGTQVTFSNFGMQAPLELKEKWDPDHAKRLKLVKALEPRLSDFAVHMGGATSIDITRKGVDKAYGLSQVLKATGITSDKLLFIGDELRPGGNDEPALALHEDSRPVSGPEDTKKVIKEILG
jgi:phosphomannomutase